MGQVRILFLADSHLGFDLPARARGVKRHRGPDFLANYARALEPALRGEADVVVHGGDVFDRSRVLPSLGWQALEPLVRIADGGVPVLVVPGNHERSRLPHGRFARHPLVHVFDVPKTVRVETRGVRLTFTGFPYERKNVRGRFRALLREAGWGSHNTDVSFLCIHHCVEGATVGPGDFTFTSNDDVIRACDIPGECAAVLSGHIHRHQVLTRDLKGSRLPAPVLYPGSIERTATAEIGEQKGYMLLDVGLEGSRPVVDWKFQELPARPMVVRELRITGKSARVVQYELQSLLGEIRPDAVVFLRLAGTPSDAVKRVLAARSIRAIAPPEMNVELRFDRPFRRPSGVRRNGEQPMLDLFV